MLGWRQAGSFMRFLVTLGLSAGLSYLTFLYPIEGRSVARHLGELWQLPEVQHKASLVRGELATLGSRLRGAPSRPRAAGDQGRLDATDRQGLDAIIRRAEADGGGQ